MKTQKTRLFGALAFSAGALAVAAGTQAQTFDFTYTDSVITAFGSLTAIDNLNGTFTATSGFVNIAGVPWAGVFLFYPGPSPSPLGNFNFDNLLYYPGNPYLDVFGLLFIGPGGPGDREVNIWGNGANLPYSLWSANTPGNGLNSDYQHDDGVFTLTQTPAPGSMALVGLAGLCAARRRR